MDVELFRQNGWCLFQGLFAEEAYELSGALPAITNLFYKKWCSGVLPHNAATFDEQIVAISKASPDLLFELNGRISNLPAIKRIASSDKAVEIFSDITGVDKNLVYAQGNAAFLMNPPYQKRLQYSWHTAYQAYPKRSVFLNFWVPLIRSKTAENGTLQVANGSHKFLFPAVEGKHIARDGAQSALTQFRVPDQFVDQFEVQSIIANPGDAAIMHPLCLHSSSSNLADKPSFVFVFKIWSDISDFSISSKIDNRLYEESNRELVLPGEVDLQYSMTKSAERLF